MTLFYIHALLCMEPLYCGHVTPGTAENVLISDVATLIILYTTLSGSELKRLFSYMYSSMSTVVHVVGGICWICLTLNIFLMQEGVTPMYFAAQYSHPRLVELLLAHGADINKVQHCVM